MNARADGSSTGVLEQAETPFLGLAEPASAPADWHNCAYPLVEVRDTLGV
jgi:hypothetical protein